MLGFIATVITAALMVLVVNTLFPRPRLGSDAAPAGTTSFVRKKRLIFRSSMMDEPIVEAQGIAIRCPFVGQ